MRMCGKCVSLLGTGAFCVKCSSERNSAETGNRIDSEYHPQKTRSHIYSEQHPLENTLSLGEKRSGTKLERTSLSTDDFQQFSLGCCLSDTEDREVVCFQSEIPLKTNYCIYSEQHPVENTLLHILRATSP